MKNNIFNEDVKGFNTNDNNQSNGDDHMKYYLDVMDKKTWKKLSKSHAYGEYAKLALKAIEARELAEEGKAILLANRKEILKFKEELISKDGEIAKLDEELAKLDEERKGYEEELKGYEEELKGYEEELKGYNYKLEVKQLALDKVKEERNQYKEKCEELELENAKGVGKTDAALKINEEIQAELERQKESINNDCKIRDEYKDELSVKSEMINRFKNNIEYNKTDIAVAKRNIKRGVAVNRNKKLIRDLEAQNRYYVNQINGFHATFNEFKNKNTIINKKIVNKETNYNELKNAWVTVNAFLK